MTLTEFPVASALSRAAERWHRALLLTSETRNPQLADLANRRKRDMQSLSVVPSPFRPRRTS